MGNFRREVSSNQDTGRGLRGRIKIRYFVRRARANIGVQTTEHCGRATVWITCFDNVEKL